MGKEPPNDFSAQDTPPSRSDHNLFYRPDQPPLEISDLPSTPSQPTSKRGFPLKTSLWVMGLLLAFGASFEAGKVLSAIFHLHLGTASISRVAVTSPDVKPVSSKSTQGSTSPSAGQVSLPQTATFSYAPYRNGYINLQLQYPSAWVVNEQTQDNFSALQSLMSHQPVYLPSDSLSTVLPIADFLAPDSSATVRLLLYPSTQAPWTQPMVSLVSPRASLVGSPKTSSWHLSSRRVTTMAFSALQYGNQYNCLQAYFTSGQNTVVFLLFANQSADWTQDVLFLQHMISTISFS